MTSDEEALEYFRKLRAMPFSNKSESRQRACDLRAHKIAFLLLDFGVEIADLDKAWLYSLPNENNEIIDNIRPPITVPEYDSPIIYNLHVAPVLKTESGKELVFDTFFYEEPPTVEQWSEDFKPFKQETQLGLKRTDISYLYFEHTDFALPQRGGTSRLLYDTQRYAEADHALRHMSENPPSHRLPAAWREEENENLAQHFLYGLF